MHRPESIEHIILKKHEHPHQFIRMSFTTTQTAPKAAKKPHTTTVHGIELHDDYFWLRERENPEVIEYLEAENAYTQSVMSDSSALQEELFAEMRARIKEDDSTVPILRGDYYYYNRQEQGKQYRIYCRKLNQENAAEEIILDVNILAEGHEYFSLGAISISHNHKQLAYTADTSGREIYTLTVIDLETGLTLPDSIVGVYDNIEWDNTGSYIFYLTLDDTLRPHKVWRHAIGTEQTADECIYHDEDGTMFVVLSKSKSRKYIFVGSCSKVTTEFHVLSADTVTEPIRCLQPRMQNHEYYPDHCNDSFLIISNHNAPNNKLMKAPEQTPSMEHWQEIQAHSTKVYIESIEVFSSYYVVTERIEGLTNFRVCTYTSNEFHYISFPDASYGAWLEGNATMDTTVLRYGFVSLITPETIFEYDMESRSTVVVKQYEALGYLAQNYTTERIFATAPDGTQIPISLAYKKGLSKSANNPTLLYAYGSYGATITPRFSTGKVSLMDRGFIWAFAHIRGGGEMGRAWYENGKYLHKKNTFADYIACAEHLIEQQYTSAQHIIAEGGSAGGMLMGAISNLRPDLFKAVVAHVPFVDVINTMLDETLPLTVTEYEEWGNPNNQEYFNYMLSYSPYNNVQQQSYPHMLIKAGLNDPRVQYWEPAKWNAKLRDNNTGDSMILLKTEMGAGHGGPTGRYNYLKEIAFDYCFMLKALDMV